MSCMYIYLSPVKYALKCFTETLRHRFVWTVNKLKAKKSEIPLAITYTYCVHVVYLKHLLISYIEKRVNITTPISIDTKALFWVDHRKNGKLSPLLTSAWSPPSPHWSSVRQPPSPTATGRLWGAPGEFGADASPPPVVGATSTRRSSVVSSGETGPRWPVDAVEASPPLPSPPPSGCRARTGGTFAVVPQTVDGCLTDGGNRRRRV